MFLFGTNKDQINRVSRDVTATENITQPRFQQAATKFLNMMKLLYWWIFIVLGENISCPSFISSTESKVFSLVLSSYLFVWISVVKSICTIFKWTSVMILFPSNHFKINFKYKYQFSLEN